MGVGSMPLQALPSSPFIMASLLPDLLLLSRNEILGKVFETFMSRVNIGKAPDWNSDVPWKESPHFLLTAGVDISSWT